MLLDARICSASSLRVERRAMFAIGRRWKGLTTRLACEEDDKHCFGTEVPLLFDINDRNAWQRGNPCRSVLNCNGRGIFITINVHDIVRNREG